LVALPIKLISLEIYDNHHYLNVNVKQLKLSYFLPKLRQVCIFIGDILTGTCFVSVLDKTGSLLVFVPLGIYLLIGFGFLALGLILLLPIRKFFKEVMKTDTKEMEKLAGKIGEKKIFVLYYMVKLLPIEQDNRLKMKQDRLRAVRILGSLTA
jgi:hypothetical protein